MSKKCRLTYSTVRRFESEQVLVEIFNDDSSCATHYKQSSRNADAPLPIQILTESNETKEND